MTIDKALKWMVIFSICVYTLSAVLRLIEIIQIVFNR